MKRLNSSHQSIAAAQRNCNYHPNGAIAQHVLSATVYDESLTEQVVLKDGRYLVASKFIHRYYTIVEHEGEWQCSSKDEAVSRMCIAKCQQALAQAA